MPILGEIDGDKPVLVIASFEEDGVGPDLFLLGIERPAEESGGRSERPAHQLLSRRGGWENPGGGNGGKRFGLEAMDGVIQ